MRWRLLLFAILMTAATARAQFSDFPVPPLEGAVVDQAGILSSEGLTRIESLIRALRDSGGSQIAVLTVSSLQGLTIEEASIKVATAWQLGDEKKDDGILLMVAPHERRLRIEVGQGKEGDLPDAWARRIISEVISPLFRSGNYDDGILYGVGAIIQKTDPAFNLDQAKIVPGKIKFRRRSEGSNWGALSIVFLLFVVLRIVRGLGAGIRTPFGMRHYGIGRPSGGYSNYRTSHWGGGSSYGGFSGGGFSGGGGGFSGGGSSGSW
jgi:uncharacterized protein